MKIDFNRPKRAPASLRIAHKNRISYLCLERGILRVDGHCLLLCQEDSAIEIPGSLVSCLMVEPGVSVTHEAMKLCGENGTLVMWVGEASTRLYGCAHAHQRPDMVVRQALLASDLKSRLVAAGRLYRLMFEEEMPPSYTIEKLRGVEGSRVKKIYEQLAREHGLVWEGRDRAGSVHDCIGFATSCLYALSETVILAAGGHPGIGIIHSGDPRSMVFDLADTVKFRTVVPLAFSIAQAGASNFNMAVRHACRDSFRTTGLFEVLMANLFTIVGEDR